MQHEINQAAKWLKNGGTILYPTDTIWGLGCDACNEAAIEKVYHIKQRDPHKSMLILVRDVFMAERYLKEIPNAAYQLFEVSDEPLTLILDGAINLAPNLPAQDGSIGMRIPGDDFCQGLLSSFNKPIVSTSANFGGKASPKSFYDIEEDLKNRVDHTVDWNQNLPGTGQASSIIKIGLGGQFTIIRK